ncbi:hypothetical protein BFJ70_g4794 [Fusarium oxysporum]|nr:hypothetical protein FOWG_14584 [Fusarium oxysporum f. sp. lycopersici MN25]KAJ4128522.1 hypothetical protein NW765_012908 [Fusarium oxysporum]KAJ4273748.1 hypothetical protein NW764_012295 [Fusarium oxysporum]RKL42051.1 hypothetical protein BFJ70_g4794 [Fusarium oxysporum]
MADASVEQTPDGERSHASHEPPNISPSNDSSDVSPQAYDAYVPPTGIGYTATSALPARMQNEAGFYKSFIVEVVMNGVYDKASNSNKIKKPNWPRGNFECLHSPLRDVLGTFASTSVFYNDTEDTSGNTYIDSPSPFVHNDGQSTYKWYTETDQNVYLAFNIKSHKYIFVDPTLPIRALYFPQIFQDPSYPGFSRLGTVQFHKFSAQGLTLRNYWDNDPIHLDITNGRGLGYSGAALCLDVQALMASLCIPDDRVARRADGTHICFDSIWLLREAASLNAEDHSVCQWDSGDFHRKGNDWTSINEGIRFVYAPLDKSAWSTFVKQIVGAGLGLIPIMGPLLALNWDIMYSYLEDPAGFADYANIGKD